MEDDGDYKTETTTEVREVLIKEEVWQCDVCSSSNVVAATKCETCGNQHCSDTKPELEETEEYVITASASVSSQSECYDFSTFVPKVEVESPDTSMSIARPDSSETTTPGGSFDGDHQPPGEKMKSQVFFVLPTGALDGKLSPTRRHVCAICHAACTALSQLKTHYMLVHANERPAYACSVCNAGFTRAGNLKKHLRIHTGERPYACSECNKRFRESEYLKKHQIIHTRERPHACSECSARFSRAASLKRHQKTHTGVRFYTCSECNARFSRAQQVKKHQKTHIGSGRTPTLNVKPHLVQQEIEKGN